MHHQHNDRPPRHILAFFRWFCHPAFREDIEGDLLELFHSRVTRLGARKAKWLFIKDVLLLFRPAVIRDLNYRYQQKIINMKKNHWIKLIALNLFIVLMIVCPFIPGPSNKVVQWFSTAGQLVGIGGLFLVPIGLAWTIIEIKKMKKPKDKQVNQRLHYHLAIIATSLIAFIFFLLIFLVPNPMPKMTFAFALLLLLVGFALALTRIKKWENNNEHVSDQGVIILAFSATACITLIYLFYLLFLIVSAEVIPSILGILLLPVGLVWIIKQIRKLKDGNERKFSSVPVFLVTIPLIAFLTFKFLMEPVSNFSRDFAIKRSAALIASIEDHKSRTGQYPASIQDLYPAKKMPKPFIMGIDKFRYNKINDQYSISFSQWLDLGSLEEIVLYDKNDLKNNLKGEFAKYNYQFDLCRVKGAFASHDTKYNNWRYYLVD